MATLSSNKVIRASTIRGIDIPERSASETFTVPDDLAEEVQEALQARPDAPTVTIHGYDREPLFYVGAADPRVITSAIGIGTASTAHLVAFTVPVKVTVSSAVFRVNTASGSVDLGIYSATGTTATRIASTGAFACPSAAVTCVQALTAPVTLYPGVKYYAATVGDNATFSLSGIDTAGLPSIPGYPGIRTTVATSYPLPASVTLAETNLGELHALYFA